MSHCSLFIDIFVFITLSLLVHTQLSPIFLAPWHMLIIFHFDVKYHHNVRHATDIAALACAVTFYRDMRVIGKAAKKLLSIMQFFFYYY